MRTVEELVREIIKNWSGVWHKIENSNAPHECGKLHLQIDKAHHQLGWNPKWNFDTTVEKTVNWYKKVRLGDEATMNCLADINSYQTTKNSTDR